jgi:hypothetical protein
MSKKPKTKVEKIKHVDMTKFSVRELRQRLFTKRGTKIYPNREYTYLDDVPEQIEALDGFTAWETFHETWDILWVGINTQSKQWVPGRHNSPIRLLVAPISIVLLDDRSKRMQVPYQLKAIVNKIPLPPGLENIVETEEDIAISEALSGRVVIDEPVEEKALRMIQKNLEMLEEQKKTIESLLKNKQ